MVPAIRTEQLSRVFGSLRAVDELSLEVPTGVIFGFLGPNGAGKTTTLRLLLGLLESTSGRREVLGLDTALHGEAIREKTGALLEHPGLYERMTTLDNLELYGRIYRLSGAERSARCEELLRRFDLWESRNQPAGFLSRGMKQKLAIARALLHRPALIFLDEPTNGLDPAAAAALRSDLMALPAREGVTVFLTTHNLGEVEKMCDLIGIIHRGALRALGKPDDLRARAGRPRAVFRGAGLTEGMCATLKTRAEVVSAHLADGLLDVELRDDVPLAPLVQLLVSAGAQLEEVRPVKPSLESVYLKYAEPE